MDFNHYFSNEELEACLQDWTVRYPGLVQCSVIGKSHEDRPISLLTITNTAAGSDRSKPAVWLDANIHATELAGTTTVLSFVEHVLTNYGKDEQVTRLLDSSVFYAVPRINPDGAAAAMDKKPRFLRSGVRPYPWNEIPEGLHAQDIDGDSRILQMRIPDANGDWKASEKNPRYLVKREPGDFGGTYYRLLPEGLIENYDGYLVNIARPAAGLDFNRNFPFEWRTEDQQFGAGPFPASEPEISAVVRFIAEHRNINFALTFHTFSRVLLRPYSTKPDEQMDTADLEVFKTLGDIGTKISGYRNASTFHDFTYSPKEVTTGAFDDWMYDTFGTFVWTVELWDLPTEAGIKDRKFITWFDKHPVEEDYQVFQWIEDNIGSSGYVDWQPFDHPQLGRVEVGGWDMLYTWRNPPHAFMEKEAAKHLPFILALGDLLPHIAVQTLKTTRVGEQSWAIDLVVENSGFLPSYTSQQARKRQAARPVLAELKLPKKTNPVNTRILAGKERMEVGHLEGRSNKLSVSSIFGYASTDNRGRVQWVIEATAGTEVEITIRSERAGEIKRTVTLV
jgi:murein tripeptide amidase MpaA